MASALRETTRPKPCTQQVVDSQTTTSAPSNTPDRVTRAQLADKPQEATTIAWGGMENAHNSWVASKFAGDGAALVATAKRGDAKAQIAVTTSIILSGAIRQNQR